VPEDDRAGADDTAGAEADMIADRAADPEETPLADMDIAGDGDAAADERVICDRGAVRDSAVRPHLYIVAEPDAGLDHRAFQNEAIPSRRILRHRHRVRADIGNEIVARRTHRGAFFGAQPIDLAVSHRDDAPALDGAKPERHGFGGDDRQALE